MARTRTTHRNIARLIESGDIVQCTACGELSAYGRHNIDPQDPQQPEVVMRLGWSRGQIAHVDSACCGTWGCGHCGATNVNPNAPTQ